MSFTVRRPNLFKNLPALLLLLLALTATAQDVPPDWAVRNPSEFIPFTPQPDGAFGYSVDVFDNTAVVGAPGESLDENGMNELEFAGAAYVLEMDETGKWTIKQKIVASDREAGDQFGVSTALWGDYMFIGANNKTFYPEGEDPIPHAGAAYIFQRNEAGLWSEIRKLTSPDPYEYDYYGHSTALYGTSALVGAPYDSFDENGENYVAYAGAAYGYELLDNEWMLNQKLVSPHREVQAAFAYSIDMDALAAAIGAPFADLDANGLNPVTDAGAVYPFDREAADALLAEAGWVQGEDGIRTMTLEEDRQESDYFGLDVAIASPYLLSGAPHVDVTGENPLADAGAVYLYNNGDPGNPWAFSLEIVPDVREEHGAFGVSVRAELYAEIERAFFSDPGPQNGSYINLFIGSAGSQTDPFGQNPFEGAGALYDIVLNEPFPPGKKKSAEAIERVYYSKLVPDDRAAGDDFGISVAVDGRHLIIGADLKDYIEGGDTTYNSGAVYLLDLCPETRDTVTADLCDEYVSPSGKYVWDESGTYSDTLVNSAGCDSIVTVILVQVTLDLSVSQEGNTLVSGEEDAVYQWLDCNADNAPVPGATGRSFTPEQSGSYAVQVTRGSCTDTSECTVIEITLVPGPASLLQPRIYPNPGAEQYVLDLGDKRTGITLTIFNSTGAVVSRREFMEERMVKFRIEEPAGIYTAVVGLDNGNLYRFRLVKLQ